MKAARVMQTVQVLSQDYVSMLEHCSLFARKFPGNMVHTSLSMALSCNGLGLGSWCSPETQPKGILHDYSFSY